MKARVDVGGSTVAVAVGAVVLALGLAGCSEDPEPRLPPPPSTSPSAATSSAVAEPEAWEEKTDAGAVAFVEHWTAVFSEAFQTGDTERLAALNSRSCETCSDLVELIRDIYDQGGSITGDSWKFTQPSWSATDGSTDEVTVSGLMRIPEQEFRRPQETSRSEPATNRFTFVLKFGTDGWSATRVTRQA